MENNLKAFILLLCGFVLPSIINSQEYPFTADQWDIKSRGSIIEGFEGEEGTLQLQAGRATLKGVEFENGIIEFDIYLTKNRGFPGILFRMEDELNYEEFYLRPHQSGNPDAMQYTPVFNGLAAWQLYHDQGIAVQDGRITWKMAESRGYNAVYTFPYGKWLHVKLVIAGNRMDVYFDHKEEPTLQVRTLSRKSVSGGICLRATSAVHFANFSISKMENPKLHPLSDYSAKKVENVIQQWQISNPFAEKLLDGKYQLEDDFLKTKTWKLLESEPTGLANVMKVTTVDDQNDDTVLAKTTINSTIKQTKRLDFGYSDRVQVFCNGQLLYSGNNGFRTRDYRYLGTIGYFDAVYLPLKKGENEIIFAVSENFGGWGVQAKLENMINIQ